MASRAKQPMLSNPGKAGVAIGGGARRASMLCLLLFFALSVGCVRLSERKPPGPWYDAYQPIDDPQSSAFVSQALAKAIEEFGEPVIPPNKILLRRSKKTKASRRYPIGEDFSLTECADPTNGLFVIYIGVDPDHRNYYPLLGHECVHLLNHVITDWYMEGLATLFSRQICAELGVEWGDWERHFSRSRREPYALSYRMMSELQQAFPDEYSTLLRFTTRNGKTDSHWLFIDINAWLDTLPSERRAEAFAIIAPYAKKLRRKTNAQYGFIVPTELK